MLRKDSRIILALDEIEVSKALEVARQVEGLVDAIKINWPLLLSAGPGIISTLSGMATVICDFKVADTPNTNRLITEQTMRLGAEGIIVQGFVGRDSVRAVVEAAGGKSVFVVTEMSHPGGMEFTAPVADSLAHLAVEEGATGVIAPATRPERVRQIRRLVGDRLILTPGVGAQGGSAAEAIRNGADYVIIGRSIYEDPEPGRAAMRFRDEVLSA